MKKLQEYIFERYMDDDEYEEYKKAGKPSKQKSNEININVLLDILKESTKLTSTEKNGVTYINTSELIVSSDAINNNKKYILPENIRFGNITSNIENMRELINLFKVKFVFPKLLNLTDNVSDAVFNMTEKYDKQYSIIFDDNTTLKTRSPKNLIFPYDAIINGPVSMYIEQNNANIIVQENVSFNNEVMLFAPLSRLELYANVKVSNSPAIRVKSLKSESVLDSPEMYIYMDKAEKLTLGSNVTTLQMDCINNIENVDLSALPKNASIEIGIERSINSGTLPKFPQNLSKGSIVIQDHQKLSELINLPIKCKSLTLYNTNLKTLKGCPQYLHELKVVYTPIKDLTSSMKVVDTLEISDCDRFRNCNGAPLDISSLEIYNCENFESLEGLPADTLEKINVYNCDNFDDDQSINVYLE